ncbi:MAG TPA: TlpA disulfide reductase family protein, partial [Candidatus Cryosericum sp.]|nr:TlpA disulfide reductase family protein [Candidatus Cryosericum sp.]
MSTGDLRMLAASVIGASLIAATTQDLRVGSAPPAISAASWLNAPTPITLAALKGKVVLLDFWGLWCTRCRKEMPTLVEFHRTYAERGLVVVTIHTPEKADLVRDYLKDHEIPLIVAIDTGDTAAAYGVDSFPTYVLVDTDGLVVS